MSGKLKQELRQKRPFVSVQEEALLAILRTADQVIVPLNEVLRTAELSHSQYNILRILRGAGPEGLPCGEIGERMVRRDPDVTRLLDRLDRRELIARTRGTKDRRVVCASITPAGLTLLESLDGPVEESVRRALADVPVAHLKNLIDGLEEIRGGVQS
jgi:DNA-binding MarR family transcriptional regulator